MEVVIRMVRVGTNKKPYYRLVAAPKEFARNSRALEVLGSYDPRKKASLAVKKERLELWLKKGAKMSPTVRHLVNARTSA